MPELSGDQRLCVVLVAVGNLQQVSATLGFDIASELVDHLVRGLSGWQGENGLVARLDSVHFLVAATNLAAGDVDALVEQIGERCRNPLFTAGIALRTSAVLGAAVAPLHGNTAVELLRCAEAAVETATQRKLAHAFFERSSDEEQRRRLRLGAELPLAVSSGQLYLQYQPKVRLGDRLVLRLGRILFLHVGGRIWKCLVHQPAVAVAGGELVLHALFHLLLSQHLRPG